MTAPDRRQTRGLHLLLGLARERSRVQITLPGPMPPPLALVSAQPLGLDGFELVTWLPPHDLAHLPWASHCRSRAVYTAPACISPPACNTAS